MCHNVVLSFLLMHGGKARIPGKEVYKYFDNQDASALKYDFGGPALETSSGEK